MFWRIIGIAIALFCIIGGLSGEFVLKGTNSGGALAVFGVVILVIEIVRIVIQKKNNSED